jgi:hypothetical protein
MGFEIGRWAGLMLLARAMPAKAARPFLGDRGAGESATGEAGYCKRCKSMAGIKGSGCWLWLVFVLGKGWSSVKVCLSLSWVLRRCSVPVLHVEILH